MAAGTAARTSADLSPGERLASVSSNSASSKRCSAPVKALSTDVAVVASVAVIAVDFFVTRLLITLLY